MKEDKEKRFMSKYDKKFNATKDESLIVLL